MPTYSFVCEICGAAFERHLPYRADHHRLACPRGHQDIRRSYTSPAVIFKGHGWYVKDSRSQPAAEKA